MTKKQMIKIIQDWFDKENEPYGIYETCVDSLEFQLYIENGVFTGSYEVQSLLYKDKKFGIGTYNPYTNEPEFFELDKLKKNQVAIVYKEVLEALERWGETL